MGREREATLISEPVGKFKLGVGILCGGFGLELVRAGLIQIVRKVLALLREALGASRLGRGKWLGGGAAWGPVDLVFKTNEVAGQGHQLVAAGLFHQLLLLGFLAKREVPYLLYKGGVARRGEPQVRSHLLALKRGGEERLELLLLALDFAADPLLLLVDAAFESLQLDDGLGSAIVNATLLGSLTKLNGRALLV